MQLKVPKNSVKQRAVEQHYSCLIKIKSQVMEDVGLDMTSQEQQEHQRQDSCDSCARFRRRKSNNKTNNTTTTTVLSEQQQVPATMIVKSPLHHYNRLLPASDEEQKNCCYSKTTLIANHQIRQKLSNLQHHHALQRNTRLAATPSSADSSSSLPRRAFTSTTTTRSNWHSTSFSLGHAHFSWVALLLLALVSHMPRPCLGSPLPLFAEVAPPSYANTPHSLGAMSNKTSDDADEYSQNSNSELLGVAKPKWMDPCGLSSARSHLAPPLAMAKGGVAIEPLSESELVRNVVLAAKHALAHSRFFRQDYVKKTFRSRNYWSHHNMWKDMRYGWLPSWQEVPKNLHERPHQSHLENLEMVSSLQNMYTFLQKLAVGLEQVVLDQSVYDGRFMEEFNEAEFKLKTVLCELQVAMLAKGVKPKEIIQRDIMDENVRDEPNEAYRNLRDWYIYRDYMNGLEYIVDAFTHFGRRQNSSPLVGGRRRRRRRRRGTHF